MVFAGSWPLIEKIKPEGLAANEEGLTVGYKLSINSARRGDGAQTGRSVCARPRGSDLRTRQEDGDTRVRTRQAPRGKTLCSKTHSALSRRGTVPVEPSEGCARGEPRPETSPQLELGLRKEVALVEPEPEDALVETLPLELGVEK